MSGQATTSTHPTQLASVISLQLSNPKGNQHPRINNKKGKNNRKGGNKNENANNNDKNTKAGEDKQSKCKVKFPCKLCKEDHLTHLCPHMEDSSRFITQGPTMLTNPLPLLYPTIKI